MSTIPLTRQARFGAVWLDPPPAGSAAAKLYEHYTGAFRLSDAVKARRAELKASGKFTDSGVVDQAKAFALNEVVPPLKRARDAIAKARRDVEALQGAIKPPALDPAGHPMRAEIRAWLRTMPAEERTRLLAKPPTEVVEAILEAPFAAMVGIGAETRDRILRDALHKVSPDAAAEVAALEKAIERTEAAIEGVRAEISSDAGFASVGEFNTLAEPIERRLTAPYLKKFMEDGVEVIRTLQWDGKAQTGSWTKATAQQIENGIFFASSEEYARVNPDWKVNGVDPNAQHAAPPPAVSWAAAKTLEEKAAFLAAQRDAAA